jgi:hypothetical protein
MVGPGDGSQQAGLLPDTVPLPGGNGSVRLPVSGDESARMLLDERAVASNFMLGPEWGCTSSEGHTRNVMQRTHAQCNASVAGSHERPPVPLGVPNREPRA